jgi:hypothetical protein
MQRSSVQTVLERGEVEALTYAFLTSALNMSTAEWSASRPGLFIPGEGTAVPIGEEAEWVLGPVWMR